MLFFDSIGQYFIHSERVSHTVVTHRFLASAIWVAAEYLTAEGLQSTMKMLRRSFVLPAAPLPPKTFSGMNGMESSRAARYILAQQL